MSERLRGLGAAVGATAAVSVGAVIAKSQFNEVSPLGAVTLRLICATVILAVIVRPQVWSLSASQWRVASAFGVTLGLTYMLIYIAYESLAVGIAVTIQMLGPLVLALVHARRVRDALWAVLALVGVAMLSLRPGSDAAVVGIVCAMLAAVGWAGSIVLTRSVGRSFSGFDGLVVALAVATVVSLPTGIVPGIQAVAADPSILVAFVCVAALSTVLPHVLEIVALRHIPVRVFGVLQSLVPVGTALCGLFLLSERLDVLSTLAIGLVAVASAGVTLTVRETTSAACGKGKTQAA